MREVCADLEGQGLGSYDEYGAFYITVPGGIDRESDWMDYEVWQRSHLPASSRASERPARSRGQLSCTAHRHSARLSRGPGCLSKAQAERDR